MDSLIATTVTIGEHYVAKLGPLTLNVDTIWSTGVAGVLVLGLGFWLRRNITSGVPNRVQLFWETVVGTIQNQVEAYIGPVGSEAVPLAVALFMFILFSNLLDLIPTGTRPVHLPAPTSDVNLTYALAATVFIMVLAVAIRARGFRGYLAGFAQPKKMLLPINIIEEIAKPFTLALRLFGNVFAGGLMIVLLSLWLTNAPIYLRPVPALLQVVWKLFDMFIALIQAFIFSLLTLLYYQFATEGH